MRIFHALTHTFSVLGTTLAGVGTVACVTTDSMHPLEPWKVRTMMAGFFIGALSKAMHAFLDYYNRGVTTTTEPEDKP